jgi:hypothetical protein
MAIAMGKKASPIKIGWGEKEATAKRIIPKIMRT